MVAWLADPAHWTGPDGIPVRILEHLVLSGLSVLMAMAIALPAGAYIGHTGRFRLVAVTVANVGRALPTLALLVIFLPPILRLGLGLGFWPTFVPLVLLGIPPILTNAYVSISETDRDARDAAYAMGMRGRQVLLGVELPLALAGIFAGVRVAAVQVIATATLGALVAGGGLGRYIIDGLARQDLPRMVVGAVLVALLALAADRLLGLVERRLSSPGTRAAGATVGGIERYARTAA
jgi:osmoprotectant transport system permease protein